MKFPTIDKTKTVTITVGDIVNLTALLTAGAHAIAKCAFEVKEEHPQGFVAGLTLARGSHAYMVKLFGLMGVEPDDVEEFSNHLMATERAEVEAKTATKQ